MLRGLRFALLTALVAVPVAALEIAGVRLPDTTAVNGQQLQLNGAGVRKKFIVKVYVGALYLPAKSGDPAAIIALDAPKRMVMHFVRDVGREKIAEAWKEGFANNSAAKLAVLQQRLGNFVGLFSDMASGDEMMMTYVPSTGLKVAIRGKDAGLIEGKDFADAVFACWLGPEPPSHDLKNGVLGRQ